MYVNLGDGVVYLCIVGYLL